MADRNALVYINGEITEMDSNDTLLANISGNAETVSTILDLIQQGTNIVITGTGTLADPYIIDTAGSSSSAFNDITSGTNTTAAMVVSTGATLTPSGTGIIEATSSHALSLAPVPSADLTANGTTMTLTAGENLTFGDIVYVKNDGKMWKADANASGLFPANYMALATIVADATGLFLKSGYVRNDAWSWTVGGKISYLQPLAA